MKTEDIKVYLPKFLSAESNKELFEGLQEFPNNLDTRIYTNFLTESDIIYQGDAIKEMLVINLPETKVKPVASVVLSNTCDIDLQNERLYPSQIVYTPIINLKKYRKLLYEKTRNNANILFTQV